MRLHVLTADALGPVVRHRVRALRPHLVAAGFGELVVDEIPKRLRERIELFRRAAAADVVVLQRKLFTRAELLLLRRAVPRLAFDVDDAVMHRDPFRGDLLSRVRAARFRATVRAADLVLAGNAVLHAAVSAAAPGTRCVTAPTPVDTARYAPAASPPEPRATFRVGWIGSRSTRPYLAAVAAPLARLVAAHADVRVAVCADQPPELPVPVEFTPWSEEAELPFLRSLDVGLMPLTDDAWSRGKCGFKLLQYMACGVASVASPVGVNVEIADRGRAALLAPDAESFGSALARLHAERDVAADLGRRGRAEVLANWSVDVVGPRTAQALADLVRGGASA